MISNKVLLQILLCNETENIWLSYHNMPLSLSSDCITDITNLIQDSFSNEFVVKLKSKIPLSPALHEINIKSKYPNQMRSCAFM